MKKIIAFIISVALSYFTAPPVGKWFDANYATSGFIYWGPFPGFLDGWLFSYVFFASLIIPVFTGRIKTGIYFTLPVLVIDLILGSFYPSLMIDLILLAAGLGLAWLILLVTRQAGKKIF